MTLRETILAEFSLRADESHNLARTTDGAVRASLDGQALAWRQAFDLADDLTRGAGLAQRRVRLIPGEREQLQRELAEALDLAGRRALRIVELEAQVTAGFRALTESAIAAHRLLGPHLSGHLPA